MSPGLTAEASAVIPVTEEDAENMTVEDDRLADILGLTEEEPSAKAPEIRGMQEASGSGGQGLTPPQEVVSGAARDSGGDTGGVEVGRAPRYAPPNESICRK